ncbi:hypothetical protein QR680_014731 [Steinernema hermaphroditum]|uniref:Mediator of RNA polymerase II transcription subunit 7 n=1 Tax=Steinernema hermaphroditum TaxID=289476 RepID=A0AA39M4F1_9BILA|nr:hypothetical protein QR680_014731 [Steinernema hermaphroditum]
MSEREELQGVDRIGVYTSRLKAKKAELNRKLNQKTKDLAALERQIEVERERLRQLDVQYEAEKKRRDRLGVALDSAQARLNGLEEEGAHLMLSNKPEETSPFPKPPEYARHYTAEAIKCGRVPAPPPVPIEYEVFGERYNLEEELVVPLKALGIQAYSTIGLSWRDEFKKMNASVVINFLDLLQILINSPDSPERVQKIEAIRLLFINMHHMVNEYRPVQARATLAVMLEHQIKEMQKLTDDVRKLQFRGIDVVNQTLSHVQEGEAVPLPNIPGAVRTQDIVRRDKELNLDILKAEQDLANLMESLMSPKEGAEPDTNPDVPDIPLRYPIEDELEMDDL